MHCQQLEKVLNDYLNSTQLSDHCPNGLQIEGRKEIKKVATAVSVDMATIEKAISANVDALIAHHGLFWFKDSYPIVGVKKKKIGRLLEAGISLFAYHLPLDMHSSIGNNWKAAMDMGWQNLEPFGTYNGMQIGVKGTFNPLSINHFVANVEGYYGHAATCALGGKEVVTSGALVSGGAYKILQEAASEQIDCFITGNFDEPAWSLAHEERIHFLALGHTATEKVGPKALAEYLKKSHSLEACFLESENPF